MTATVTDRQEAFERYLALHALGLLLCNVADVAHDVLPDDFDESLIVVEGSEELFEELFPESDHVIAGDGDWRRPEQQLAMAKADLLTSRLAHRLADSADKLRGIGNGFAAAAESTLAHAAKADPDA